MIRPFFRLAIASVSVMTMAVLTGCGKRNANDLQGIFNEKCAPCHAADGSGNTPIGQSTGIPDLRSADIQKLSDDMIAAVIQRGTTKMPPVQSLSAEQVRKLVSYIRGFANQR
jgi:mono/diheme cytochrome c family protein